MNFRDFIGMPDHVEKLILSLKNGDWRHAYLFSGGWGTGKRSIANLACRIIHCTGADKPCGVCDMCRLMAADSHPDHLVVRPEKSIGVDQVRAVISKLTERPFEAGGHTVIIEDADKMTAAAQNALLKTLESPVGDATIFLVTEIKSALLQTVLSRMAAIRFEGISDGDMLLALSKKGVDGNRARTVLPAAHGSVGRALELLEDESYFKIKADVEAALSKIGSDASVFDGVEAFFPEAEQGQKILSVMEDIASFALRNPEAGANYDPLKMLLLTGAARKSLNANVKWQSVIEMLFFRLLANDKPGGVTYGDGDRRSL